MNFISGKKLCAFMLVMLAAAFGGAACQKAQTTANKEEIVVKAASPTEAYKMLFAAVKAKETTRIRQLLSKNSMNLAGMGAKQFGHTMEKQIENGMLPTTAADALPPLRDERVKGNFGAVEIFNQKTGQWENTAFILEDGGWKLAVGDLVSGTYQSPGKGQAEIEADAAGANINNMTRLPANTAGKFPLNGTNGKSQIGGNAVGDKVKTAEVPIEKANKKPVDNEKK